MKRLTISAALLTLLGTLLFGSAWAASNTLPGGTPIQVNINTPADGTEIKLPPDQTTVDVTVTGTASIGASSPTPDTTLIYVLDASGSTGGLTGVDCGADQQTDDPQSVEDEIIDCEIAAAINLNNQVINLGVIDEVAVIIFAGDAVTADASPNSGSQPLIAPNANNNGNGLNDVDEVLQSIKVAVFANQEGEFAKFSNHPIPNLFGTDYADALREALSVSTRVSNPNVTVVFISDGSNTAGDPVTDVLPAGDVVFHTFSIPSQSSQANCSNNEGLGSLQDIADLTGGTCTEVDDPSELPGILPDVIIPTLKSLEIEVDGGGAIPIGNAEIEPGLPQNGPMTVNYSTPLSGLGLGRHEICVTANGSDAGGSGSVKACVTIRVVQEKPTAITLAAFQVEANDGRATITWQTATEIDNAGFNLYRAASPDGPWTPINSALIAARGDPVAGANYTFVDTPGRGTFYYRLEDVDYYGTATRHQPVMAQTGAALRVPWYRPSLPRFE